MALREYVNGITSDIKTGFKGIRDLLNALETARPTQEDVPGLWQAFTSARKDRLSQPAGTPSSEPSPEVPPTNLS